jgi:hypothetical protein
MWQHERMAAYTVAGLTEQHTINDRPIGGIQAVIAWFACHLKVGDTAAWNSGESAAPALAYEVKLDSGEVNVRLGGAVVFTASDQGEPQRLTRVFTFLVPRLRCGDSFTYHG